MKSADGPEAQIQIFAQLLQAQPRRALQDAEAAAAAEPRNPLALVERGLAREKVLGPGDAALEDLRQAADFDPSLSHFYAEALVRRRQSMAGAGFKPAVDLAPSYPTASRLPAAFAGLCSLLVCAGIYVLLSRLWADDDRKA